VRVWKEATDAQHIHFSYGGAACGSAVSTVDSVSAPCCQTKTRGKRSEAWRLGTGPLDSASRRLWWPLGRKWPSAGTGPRLVLDRGTAN